MKSKKYLLSSSLIILMSVFLGCGSSPTTELKKSTSSQTIMGREISARVVKLPEKEDGNMMIALRTTLNGELHGWTNTASERGLNSMEQLLGGGFEKNVRLIVNDTDTINALGSHLERTYGVGFNDQMLVNFEIKKEALENVKTLRVLYEDEIYNLGRYSFKLL